ncbi:hypothetical protein K443DRAFT_677494 [Laccaria amethystina LaAM-08-1]|uniref:Uncharacterized protein n=1 Tax=Laccaria amethystina LaAM-08-1 TaxID=1095629 RepID=A0A0C9XLV8_9AGAR|nr:hypothetical protein K443DRAFT_677494 [Laccaria amethystina LaAM-08-1]
MRRAQSVRHYARPSLALAADDLGMLREGDESNEDVLRKQLLDKDRENDKLRTQVQILQDQLAQRPPLETIQELDREYKNLELLLQGTQRENERCMAELERAKTREKMLERELTRLAGENWQSNLELGSTASAILPGGRSNFRHARSNTISSPSPTLSLSRNQATPSPDRPRSRINQQQEQQQNTGSATLAHIEQVRMLILGMEQRLQVREEKLVKVVERAEGEGRRFEQLRTEISVTDA